jgi:hypothetical protein
MFRARGRSSVTSMIDTALELRGVGEAVLAALAARDFDGLRRRLADDVRFRLLVPRGPQAEAGAHDTVARFVGWYGGAIELEVESSYVDILADRLVLTYRIRLRDAEGSRRLEQHLVCGVGSDGRLATIDLLCTGFHSA